MSKKRHNGKSAKENVLDIIKKTELIPSEYKSMETGEVTDKSDYNSLKNICVITEDRGNGYQFILSYILQNYPEMSGIVIGSTGKDGLRYILEEYHDYDAYIFVFDSGISDREYDVLSNTISQFKKNRNDIPMYIFQPKCMEEVWLSFYRLDEYIQLNNSTEALDLQNELAKIIQGAIEEIDYNKYKNLQTSTPEQICEKLVFELTDGTPFKCYHGQKAIKGVQPRKEAYLSPCWRCPCCTVEKYDEKVQYVKSEDCKKPSITGNKMDYIAQHSLLCGMTYIIDKIYGFHFHYEGYWHDMKKSYFDELVKEL